MWGFPCLRWQARSVEATKASGLLFSVIELLLSHLIVGGRYEISLSGPGKAGGVSHQATVSMHGNPSLHLFLFPEMTSVAPYHDRIPLKPQSELSSPVYRPQCCVLCRFNAIGAAP
jgi:hypothetical protein